MTIKDKFDKPPVTNQPTSDVNAYNSDGLTEIQAAILAGDVEKVEELVTDKNVNPNKLSAHGMATVFYIKEYQRANGGTNHYTGQSPLTHASEAIDRNARRMTDAIKSVCKRELASTLGMQ